MPAKPKPPPKGDPLVERLDTFANVLLDKASGDGIDFRDQLDAFKEAARWIAVKKGLGDGGSGESLAEFKQRIHAEASEADRRTARSIRGPRVAIREPPRSGGHALDAIKGRLPDANPRNDAGGGNGAQRASVGAPGSLGDILAGDDGHD